MHDEKCAKTYVLETDWGKTEELVRMKWEKNTSNQLKILEMTMGMHLKNFNNNNNNNALKCHRKCADNHHSMNFE